jgi:hypothetical protein
VNSTLHRALAGIALFSVLLSAAVAGAAESRPEEDIAAQLQKFRTVKMPLNSAALSPRERRLVEKLAQATRLADEIFWQQSDPQGLALYRSLAKSGKPEDQALRRFLRINGGRYDLIRENAPFAGAGPKPPGGSVFPADLTRQEFDAYVDKHPQRKAALYEPLTVIKRKGGELVTVPYHVAYRRWLTPMAAALTGAAALSDDPAFAKFLRLRAQALLDDDYFASDLAWLDLVNPKFDLILAPYETYLDNFLGIKASFGAAILIRNDAESDKLQVFQKFVPDIQDALPLPAPDRPSKRGHASPMEVMDAPLRGGDLRHGYQAVADNLPNDPRVHEQKGSKKIFFKNFMDARVDYVILPIAKRMMQEEQAGLASAEGYLTDTLMHEISHGLGPDFARTAGGRQDIRAAIGPRYSALEEAKADIVGLYGLKWLTERGDFPRAKLDACYASNVAGIFRTVRFSIAEAHGQAEIMEFNFFSEKGVIKIDADSGRYRIDFAAMPAAVAALAQELLEQEASGDRARVDAWFAKYGTMPAGLAKALERVSDVPVDVDPVFELETF